MSVSFAELEEQVRRLSTEDRARLAALLLESLQETKLGEIQAAWGDEVTARVTSYDRGETETFSAEDVFAEARRFAR